MSLFDAFDHGFDHAEVTSSVSRKGDDGITRSAKLTGAVPTGMSVEEFAEAAKYGLKRARGKQERGLTMKNVAPDLTGDKAERALLSMADPVPAKPSDPVPDKVKARGRSVQPSGNGSPAADGAAK